MNSSSHFNNKDTKTQILHEKAPQLGSWLILCPGYVNKISIWKKNKPQHWGYLKDSRHKGGTASILSDRFCTQKDSWVGVPDAGHVRSPHFIIHALPPPFPKILCSAKDQKSTFFSGNHRGEDLLISAFTPPGLGRLRPHLK